MQQSHIEQVRGKNFQKEWNASGLAAKLEALHPSFYPCPGKQVFGSDGKVARVDDIVDGFLTLPELKKLYAECGGRLHIGNVKSLLEDKRPPVQIDRIQMWQSKIISLLNHHQIQLSDPDYQLWTIMQSRKDGGVHVALFKRVDQQSS